MEFRKLVEQLNDLNLPRDQYVVVGSGSMAAHGIREANDFDVLVTEDLWNELSSKYPVEGEEAFGYMNLGDIQIMCKGSMFNVPEIASVDKMIDTTETFETHRFLNLELLKKFKLKKAREKDLKDVELIDKYLTDFFTKRIKVVE